MCCAHTPCRFACRFLLAAASSFRHLCTKAGLAKLCCKLSARLFETAGREQFVHVGWMPDYRLATEQTFAMYPWQLVRVGQPDSAHTAVIRCLSPTTHGERRSSCMRRPAGSGCCKLSLQQLCVTVLDLHYSPTMLPVVTGGKRSKSGTNLRRLARQAGRPAAIVSDKDFWMPLLARSRVPGRPGPDALQTHSTFSLLLLADGAAAADHRRHQSSASQPNLGCRGERWPGLVCLAVFPLLGRVSPARYVHST